MKQKMMLAAIAAVVGVGGFAGFNAFQNNSSVSDILLANAEALAGPIVEIVYADGCLSGGEELCVMTPFQYFDKSTSVYN
ncbi:MAG: hypothetical protein K2M85_09115 [Paramuribaculum sp.]|nr:hypothetical protein [Paramuribaculum sp.]